MIDGLIVQFDQVLRAVMSAPCPPSRVAPGAALSDAELGEEEKNISAALMRVNHSGEVCAQALYQGQACSADDAAVRAALRATAREEAEHLAWAADRIRELGGRASLLNPVWYVGALTLGLVAGKTGIGWNLGFLAETERQVEAHLAGHLDRLPAADHRTRAILLQMKADEAAHARKAERLGARELPEAVRIGMKLASRLMTGIAYHV